MQIILVYGLLYATVVYVTLFVARRVYGTSFSFSKVSRGLLALALVSLVIAGLVGSYSESIPANFFQHAVGGGVVSGLACIAVVQGLELRLSRFSLLLVIVASVSTLGVMNELLEYFLQTVTPLTFSYDSTDTWRDFIANTSGALLAWAVGTFFFWRDK